jgi:uncharacterized protein (TIGR00730 family)
MLSSICVFCGSSPGADPRYRDAAAALGSALARSGRRLVFGGGRVGLMGAVADAALAAGGDVVGVIPRHLADREVAHLGLGDLRVVNSMHERKALMSDLADAFIALPGGLGTLEELFEVWTWGQLGLHRKPYGLLNTAGYFDALLAFLAHGVEQRFVKAEHREMLVVETEVMRLIEALEEKEMPRVQKWIDREAT